MSNLTDLINALGATPEVVTPLNATRQGTILDDSFFLSGANNAVIMYDGNDDVFGNSGTDFVALNQGNDWADGAFGTDYIWGGKGDDTVWGGYDADILWGNMGNDRLYGESGDDLLYGGQNDDYLSGGPGSDILLGDKGNDTIFSGTGINYFVFGNDSGVDALGDFSSAFDWFVVYENVNGSGIHTYQDVVNRTTSDGMGGIWVDLGLGNRVHIEGQSALLETDVLII